MTIENELENNVTDNDEEIIIKEKKEEIPPIADTRESRFQAFLEEIGLVNIDSFGVATTVTLTDIAGNEQDSSSIIGVPLLSFETAEGFFPSELDARFFGVIKIPQTVSLNLQGTVEFLVDQDIISTKKLFISGEIRDSNNIPLNVVDVIPPPLGDRPFEFNYQFDEETVIPTEPLLLQLFPNGVTEESLLSQIATLESQIANPLVSEDIKPQFRFKLQQLQIVLSEIQGTPITSHVFRVIIRDLTGTFVAEGKQDFIDWTGEFIAYELGFNVDKRRATIINEENEVISVLKSDDRVLVCGSPSRDTVQTVSGTYPFQCTGTVPEQGILFDVKVFENIGGNVTGVQVGEVLATDEIACQEITGIQRVHEYIIQVDNEQFPISTPFSQKDYSVTYSTGGGTTFISSINGGEFRDRTFVGWECKTRESFDAGTSNFGYSFDSRSP